MRRAAAGAAAVVLVFLFAPPADADTRSFLSDVEDDIDGLLDRYQVPTARLAVVEGGEVLSSDPEPLFAVASLSKTATSLAVLRLVEKGKIDLDAPVDSYLERWKVPDSRWDERDVTLRRLLSHTAGFPFGSPDEQVPIDEKRPSIVKVLEGELGGVHAELVSKPGTVFTYSNIGYGVVELAIEDVTGEKYADVMRDLVLEPLEMDDSGFLDDEELAERLVPGFFRAGRPASPDLSALRAAGGMISSSGDIGRLLIGTSLPKEDGGLLKQESLDEMRELCEACTDVFGLGEHGGYALGIAVLELPSGKRIVGNNGSHADYNALMLGVPSDRTGFAVVTNSATGIGVELELALRWFDDVAREQPEIARRFEITRTWLRILSLLVIALCVVYLLKVGLDLRRGRRVQKSPSVARVLLRSGSSAVIAAALFSVFNTGLLTRLMGGIAPARFISSDYTVIISGLAVSLVGVGVVSTIYRKKKA